MTTVREVAETQLGVPYKLGSAAGRTLWDAARQAYFDCSGFVAWAYYRATGVKLPAFTDALASDPRLHQVLDPQPGDVVLFKFTDTGQPGVKYPHAAIYLGNSQVIESGSADASRSSVNVMPLLERLNPRFYRVDLTGGGNQIVTPPPAGGTFNPDPGPIGQIPMPDGPTPPGTPRTPGEANPGAFAPCTFEPNDCSKIADDKTPVVGGMIKSIAVAQCQLSNAIGPIGSAFCYIGQLVKWFTVQGHWWSMAIVGGGLALIAIGLSIYFKPELAQGVRQFGAAAA